MIFTTKLLSEYAREQLHLTGEKPPPINITEEKSLAKHFFEVENVEDDVSHLIDECHIHKCGAFCMRYNKRSLFIVVQDLNNNSTVCRKWKHQTGSKVKRCFCREQAGEEQTAGMADTPGFELYDVDTIVQDDKRNSLD